MQQIAIAFPRDPQERQRLRDLVPNYALPAIVPDSFDMTCEGCPRILAVGPRVRAVVLLKQASLLCVQCALRRGFHFNSQVFSLGNPDSRPEDV